MKKNLKKVLKKITTSVLAVAFAFTMCEPAQIKANRLMTLTPAEASTNMAKKEFEHTCYDSNGEAILKYSVTPTFSFDGTHVSMVSSPSSLVIYDYDKVLEAITYEEPSGLHASFTYRVGYQYSDTEQRFVTITYRCDVFGNVIESITPEESYIASEQDFAE